MRDNEIVGLWEAYLQVHQPKEEVEQLDELSSEVISRAGHGRRKNLSAAQREEMRARNAGASMGEISRLAANTSAASAKDIEHRELSTKHARSRKKRTGDAGQNVNDSYEYEVENWVNSLIDEGYDLSEYTWDDMYEIYMTEGRNTSLSALSAESEKRKADKKRGRPETEAEVHGRLALGDFRPGASQEERARGGRQRLKDRGKVPQKGGKDMFEHVLEYLVAEGYADTNESALVIMANMSEEWRDGILQQLDERGLSLKTKMKAFKDRATREFESDGDNPKDFTKSGKSKADITKANIVNKHGKTAGKHAERAAHAGIFGRKSSSMPKKPVKEQTDLYDIILSHLLDEGYADTNESALVIMANMSEEWRESIVEELEQLDEISLKTKMKAYAATQDPEADYQYGSKVHAQGDRIRKAIVKKHGEKAGEHADAHADSKHWGRIDPRTSKPQGYAKPRIEKNRTYRTTKKGTMHRQDQEKLKSDLIKRRNQG